MHIDRHRNSVITFVIILCILVQSACLPRKLQVKDLFTEGESAKEYVLIKINVLESRYGKMKINQNIWWSGDRIWKVENHQAVTESQNRVIIDAQGKTVVPGFVDLHVHLTGSETLPQQKIRPSAEYHAQAYVYAGVTTVLNLGTPKIEIKKVMQLQKDQDAITPSIYDVGAPLTGVGAHPIPLSKRLVGFPLNFFVSSMVYQAKSEKDIEAWIEDGRSRKQKFYKVMYDELPEGSGQMSQELLQQAISAVHKEKARAFVHIGSEQDIEDAIDARADGIAHIPYRSVLSDRNARRIAVSRLIVIPTIYAWHALDDILKDQYTLSDFQKKMTPTQLHFVEQKGSAQNLREDPIFHEVAQTTAAYRHEWMKTLQKLYKSGARLALGTDSSLPGVFPGGSFHEEMKLWAKAGIPAVEVFQIATWGNAQVLESVPDFGVIEKNMRADMILIDGNPLEDMNALNQIEKVYLRGRELKPQPLN